jgi:hypothetical protein
MGPFLDSIQKIWKRKAGPSWQTHKDKKELEKNQVEGIK